MLVAVFSHHLLRDDFVFCFQFDSYFFGLFQCSLTFFLLPLALPNYDLRDPRTASESRVYPVIYCLIPAPIAS